MTVTEGGGKRAIAKKFQDVYIPALKANYIIWPAVQMLNFRVLPIQFQIVSSCGLAYCLWHITVSMLISYQPFVSTIGIAWTAYLSMTNNAIED